MDSARPPPPPFGETPKKTWFFFYASPFIDIDISNFPVSENVLETHIITNIILDLLVAVDFGPTLVAY